jgi:hypothetical protein
MENSKKESKQEKWNILDFFYGEAYRLYNVEFSKKLNSILAAILYYELVNRQKYHTNSKELIDIPNHGSGWFYYTREKGSDRLGMSAQEQRTALEILVKHGLVQKAKFGLPCKIYYRVPQEPLEKFLGFSNNVSRNAESTNWMNENNKLDVKNQQTAHIREDIYLRDIPKINTSPTPSPESPKQEAPPAVAVAPEKEVVSSQDLLPEKSLSPPAKEVASLMIASLQKFSATYRPPKNMEKFNKFVKKLIDEQKQDPKTVLAVFNYALQDTEERGTFKGWSSVMYAGCPSEKLHTHFVSIDAQMKSRPKRNVDRVTKNMDGTPVELERKKF